MAEKIETGSDIVVASRYMKGGSVGDWVTGRRILSTIATFLASHLPRVKVSDPMSGFFAIRESSYNRIAYKLRPTGFKILLEVLAHLPRKTKVSEVPLHFQKRLSGESKLSLRIELQFMRQLLRIFLARMHLWVFGIVALIILMILLVNIWRLQLLYTNSVVRNNIQTTMRRASDEQGWLLSDMSISSVASDSIDVNVRFHHRGQDEEECYRLYYNASPLRPCSDF